MTEEREGTAQEPWPKRQMLGEKLRQAREYLGLKQEEVAKHLGVPRSALSNIEAGQRRVEALELQKLARLYQRPTSWFTGEEPVQSELPRDVAHLARAAASLSESDREELGRFADFLRARAKARASNDDK